jgi:hypothetical protein
MFTFNTVNFHSHSVLSNLIYYRKYPAYPNLKDLPLSFRVLYLGLTQNVKTTYQIWVCSESRTCKSIYEGLYRLAKICRTD